ncbi:hypothetical protein SMQE32_46330 [Serratia marcescens]|nr:hypothetical protein SMQE32_46330 [Serratia marcescens]
MLTGTNITASSVLEEYKKTVFNESINKSEINKTVAYIRECVERLEYISSGEWPFENDDNNKWHKSKLDLLINKLKHFCMQCHYYWLQVSHPKITLSIL